MFSSNNHIQMERIKLTLRHFDIWARQIDNLESAKRAGDLFGYPLMVKSRRLAYDGRGNAVAKSEEDLSSAVNGNILSIYYIHKSYKIKIIFTFANTRPLVNTVVFI